MRISPSTKPGTASNPNALVLVILSNHVPAL